MNWISSLGDSIRKIVLLEDKMQRLGEDVAAMNKRLLDHEKRLIRIETMIEMAGVQQPSNPPQIQND